MGKLDKMVRQLGRHVRQMSRVSGERGKRNTRQRILKALRDCRHALDDELPMVPKQRKPRRKNGQARLAWTHVPYTELSKFAAAGVKIMWRGGYPHVPTWAADLRDASVTDLRKARTDIKFRRSRLALGRLRESL